MKNNDKEKHDDSQESSVGIYIQARNRKINNKVKSPKYSKLPKQANIKTMFDYLLIDR